MRRMKLPCLTACLSFSLLICTNAAWSAPPHPTAYLSFSADRTEYAVGERALLSWASSNTMFCQASGDWSGKLETQGSYRTPPLDGAKTYSLKCNAQGGGVEQIIRVSVTSPVSHSEPTLSFTTADASVDEGGSTTLRWTATDADSCSASGGWSGAKSASGSESVGPLSADTTFTLSCSGPGGSTSGSVAVDVMTAPPSVSLTAASSSIENGSSTTLSWSADNATSCSAGGGWSGSKSLSGSESVSPTADTTYNLSCTGEGGSDSASATVAVETTAPALSFTAADTSVVEGGATSLSWTATHADGCIASGGWSGSKTASGSESVGPLTGSTTYSLSCTGPGGSVIEMLSVNVIGEVKIAWEAPTRNEDGTALTDLAGYRVYYGNVSGTYDDVVEVSDPTSTTHSLRLSSGTYYVAMTAVDADGNESAHSNEVSKTVP